MSPSGANFHLDSIHHAFNGKPALQGIDLEIRPGELVAFVGPSGAGKTSVLRLLNGTVRPNSGTVSVDGRRIDDLTPADLKTLRAGIGFVHQDLSLVPNLRVSQNVLAGRLGRMGFWTSLRTMIRPRRNELEQVHAILERVGIPEKIFQRTDQLSGGQMQRAAIARALYQDVRALLVDEPVSSLDPARARDTIRLLTSICRQEELTLVTSMHDLALAREFFPRLIGLRGGKVQFDRAPEEIGESKFDALYELAVEEILADGC